MGFQTAVNQQQAPAVEGDFCSANPRASVIAGEGAFIAGAVGAVVGRFAWATAAGLVTNVGAGVPTGFIHRDMQALITAWLGSESMLIPEGVAVTLHRSGDFWVKTLTVATVGQKVFASNLDGSIKTGAAAAVIANHTETAWFVDSAGAVNELIKISQRG